MRFASALYVGLALLVAASVAFVSFQQRNTSASRAMAHDRVLQTCLLVPADGDAVRRMNAKSNVTRQLIDGQKTLMEAAAWFRYINAAAGREGTVVFPGEETQSEDERTCRLVIRWAMAIVESESPNHGAALRRRLETELRAALDRPGGVMLPAVE